jgi:broad specificity phosphatase PhoE
MKNYLVAYDNAQVVPVEHNVVQLNPNEVREIYTSSLPRSIQTAELLFGHAIPIRSKDLFDEYKKHVPAIRGVELGCKTWKVLSTTTWMLGFGKDNDEKYSEAKARAKIAADFLQINAGYKGKVILVGHGFINHHIKKHLEKMGWKLILKGGSKNLGVTLLIKQR